MKISLNRRLGAFEKQLSDIVGADLARDLIMYAQSPNPLEARLLREDGFDAVPEQDRLRAIDLISRFEQQNGGSC